MMKYLPYFLFFIIFFSFGYWAIVKISKRKTKYNFSDTGAKSLSEAGITLITIFVFIIVGIIIYSFASSGFKSVTGYFGGSSKAKAYCGQHYKVLEAKTDYAAKKAFKACLKNY